MRSEQFMETVCSELFVPPQFGAVNDQSPVVVDERNPVDTPLQKHYFAPLRNLCHLKGCLYMRKSGSWFDFLIYVKEYKLKMQVVNADRF